MNIEARISDTAVAERQLRIDLAAAFRLAARMGWHEAVANHFSLAVSKDGKRILINPRWRHFGNIRASDLLLLDVNDEMVMKRPGAPDPSAWCIHSHLHAAVPQARCILHLHPPYATALASLANPEIKPIDQNTARFFNRVGVDRGFGGIADDAEEARRLAASIGNHSRLMMGNHGVIVVADTVAEAFDDMYYLERACQNLVLAYSTGQELSVLSDEIAEKTARGWEAYRPSAFAHFEQMKAMLDEHEPAYAH
jgi:ribulose-5-phosphate 4-epimerase/fuculose-1-phosphate aldolase